MSTPLSEWPEWLDWDSVRTRARQTIRNVFSERSSFVRKASKLRFLIDTDQTGNLPGMLAELEPDRMLEVEREDQSYAASVLFMASW